MITSGEDLAKWRNWAKQEALAAEIAPNEVDWLLQDVTALTPLQLRLESFRELEQIVLSISLSELTLLWEKRLFERLPVQYLVGSTPWRNFSLKVSPDVLIPRPETEYIIDLAVKAISQSNIPHLDQGNWVDLGTGSGAIAIGLAQVLTKATIYAVDKSPEALAIAHQNADNLGFEERINFKQGTWWEPLSFLKGQVSGMVSNPPYIPTDIIPSLQPEVVKHEPHLALDGGKDGLDSIRYLVNTAPEYLCPGGIWLIEMMAGQGSSIRELLQTQGSYELIEIFTDLANIERFVLAYRR